MMATCSPRASSGFEFRQFAVRHDRCAMKVGTDGILLGAWTSVNNARRILDVGTGCGLLALMLAQRNKLAQIEAVEIEQAAADQAHENVQRSPWFARVTITQASLAEFMAVAAGRNDRFHLIICNPPFFPTGTRSPHSSRSRARHHDSLTIGQLMTVAGQLLASHGRLALIVPHDLFHSTVRLAQQAGLFLSRHCAVSSFDGKPPVRDLLEFTNGQPAECVSERMSIYKERGMYNLPYRELTREFYLESTSSFRNA